MIKKIQQYLLLNYPLLWNIKIVPILLCTIAVNILFFLAGYFFTNINFSEYNYFKLFDSNGLIYFGSVISAILLFIIWLVFYSKNNAFKVFYPQKASSLYLEWLLSFIIIFSIALFPYSYQKGEVYKIRSYATKTEMIKVVETLNMIQILIPDSKNSYFQEYPTEIHQRVASMSIKGNTQTYIDQAYIDSVTSSTTNQNIYYEDYPNFTQLSLLNYSDEYNAIYIPEQYKVKINGTKIVKEWLTNEEEQKISDLIDSFLRLQEKHKLKTNLTKDQWMQLIYNPSKYPVGDFNLISSYDPTNTSFKYYYHDDNSNRYYVSYDGLKSGYKEIMDAYMDNQVQEAFILVSICFALGISLLVFSFRVTSGKAWLIAFVSIGLILFINGILSFSVDSLVDASFRKVGLAFYMFVLLILFLCEAISVLIKNNTNKNKGKSDIYINHLIWFIPAVPILIFFITYIFAEGRCSYNTEYYEPINCETYNYMEDNIVGFLWGNICLTFVSMWFFIQLVLRKWKSLPEE